MLSHLPGWGLLIHHSTGSLGNELYLRKILADLGDNVIFVPLPFKGTISL